MGQTESRPTWKNVGLFIVAYLACAELGQALSFRAAHDAFATFWPPSGLYLAILLLLSGRVEPRMLFGALVGNLVSDVVVHGRNLPLSVGYWGANTLEAICAARCLLWWTNGSVQMSRLADVVRLIAVAVAASALPGAALGATITYLSRGGSFVDQWLIWWSADALGIVVITPFLLAWRAARVRPLRKIAFRRHVEFFLLLAGQSATLAYVVFSAADAGIPKRYLMLPFLMWAAFRFGPRGVTVALLSLAFQFAAYTVNGLGPIALSGTSPERQLFELQLVLTVVVVSFLCVTAVTAERGATNRELERKQSLLQAIRRAQTEFIGEAPLAVIFQSLLEDLMKLTGSDFGFIGEALPGDDGVPLLKSHTITSLRREEDLKRFSEGKDGSDPEVRNLEMLADAVLATGQPRFGNLVFPENCSNGTVAGNGRRDSFLGLPFYFGERLIGLVGISSRTNGYPAGLPDFLAPMLTTCGHLLEMYRQKSARRRMEDELRTSQRRLEAAQARAKIGDWEYDSRTRLSYWSAEVYRLAYRNPAQGFPDLDESIEVVHPDDRASMLQTMNDVVRLGGVRSQEYRTNPRIGPMRYMSTTIERIELREDGSFVTAGIVQDITERREANIAIERSERELADFFEHANMGLQWLGLDGRVLRANPAMLDMLGLERHEYVGEHISRFHVDPHEAYELLERIEQGEELENFEAHLRCKDGTGRDVLISSNVYREEGRIRHARCFIRDISELRRLEQQFYQAQKMDAIGRLAGGVAHDFNNLLTVMNGYARLLHDGLPAGDSRRALADEISNAGERAAALTRQLLTFSRQQVVRMRVFDLNDAVCAMQTLLGRLIGEEIRLTSDFDPAPLLVRADKGQLDQVLLNLVVNARDAMPQGGVLHLRTSRGRLPDPVRAESPTIDSGLCAVLEVRDTGCGMDKATLARIFEPFFTTKPAGQGTGLGLATVYGIVKQSGGHTSVESQPGEGSTFRIYLPCLETSSDNELSENEPNDASEEFLEAAQGI